MSNSSIKITRGFDLPLKGAAPHVAEPPFVRPALVALCPDDFPGFTAKPDVREGDTVITGQPLMHSKEHPRVVLVSPVDGKVKAVVRGARRKVERVVVEPGADVQPPVASPLTPDMGREALVEALCRSGLWAWMRSRPYDVVPDPAETPRDIFVTAFDSAPLAPSLSFDPAALQAGVTLLGALTPGSVVISRPPALTLPPLEGADVVEVKGPHPAGNVGVQINALAPVNKGETVWTLDVTTLSLIGALALGRPADFSVTVAITGPALKEPHMVRTIAGASLTSLLGSEETFTQSLLKPGQHARIISGNPLTGVRESLDGFLRFPYRQITVIAEGDDRDEFMGWASLSPNKMSRSRTFLSAFMPWRRLGADARLHGSQRAMILSGVYDKAFPMDVMPEPLLKAIRARDIEQMEALGIYEVAPEDFALAEWADPSKLPLQQMVREGLDFMRLNV